MSYLPRERQQQAIDKMVEFVNSKTTKKGLFIYPTSFGKSIVIANVASKFPDKYFINVTTSKELLKQNYEKFSSYGFEASVCSASLNSKDVGKITFATAGTLIKQAEFFKDKDVVILSDEAHVGSKKGSQLFKFVSKVKNSKLIGTTATPLRLKAGMSGTELKMMNRDRDCFYSSIEDVVQISEVVKDKYWSELVYDIRSTDEKSLKLNTSGTDYTLESLKKYSDENDIVKKCVDSVNELIKEGRKSILVFLPFIEDAKKVQEELDSCAAIYSGMDDKLRDASISDFKNLKLKVISQVNILSYGFDHPELDAIVFARPTNSITIWYQGLGRGVRIHSNKSNCKIIDLSGNFQKFGKIEDINFEDKKEYGGWAAFSGDRLLTNYPLGMENVPTKTSLKEAYDREQSYKNNQLLKPNPEFYFGKYKGKKLTEVLKDKDGKSYLAWIVEPKTDFNFHGEKGNILKIGIYEELKLPIPKEKTPPKQNYQPTVKKEHKELLNNFTNNIKTFKDLEGIF